MPLVLRAKCIVVGDATVGKTAFVKSIQSHSDNSQSQFTKSYSMTTGVDISVKTIRIPDTEDIVEFYIYDSAGKDIYTEYVQSFWNNPSVAVVMYDVTNELSFKSCSTWLERVRAKKTSPDLLLPGIVVANKIDLKARRVISEDEGVTFANSKELAYCECSVKDHENVEKPLLILAQEFYKIYQTKSEHIQSLLM